MRSERVAQEKKCSDLRDIFGHHQQYLEHIESGDRERNAIITTGVPAGGTPLVEAKPGEDKVQGVLSVIQATDVLVEFTRLGTKVEDRSPSLLQKNAIEGGKGYRPFQYRLPEGCRSRVQTDPRKKGYPPVVRNEWKRSRDVVMITKNDSWRMQYPAGP